MLSWHVDEVRRHAAEDSVFRQQELGTPCRKYELARVALREAYPRLEELLDQVWNAKALSGCPPMAEWKTRLADIAPWLPEPRGFYGAGFPAPVPVVPRPFPVEAADATPHKEELPERSQRRPSVSDTRTDDQPKHGRLVKGWRRLDDPD